MEKEELIRRVKNAIILLSEKHSVKVGDLSFYCQDKDNFSVAGATHNNLLENVTRQSAVQELEDVKSLFLKMVQSSKELAEFTQEMKVEYSLYYDYGMGSIQICRQSDGEIIWETEVNR